MSVTTPEQLTGATATVAATAWVDQAAGRVGVLTDRAATIGTRLLQEYAGWFSPDEIRDMAEQLATLSLDAQTAVAGLMSEYVAQTVSALTGHAVRTPKLGTPVIRNGVPLATVYQRPMKAYRIEFAESGSAAAALDAAVARQMELVENDIMLAVREVERDAMVDLGVTQYRRVLRPERSKSGSCLLCVAASLNIYKTKDLLPIHNGCRCLVLPVIGDQDPGDEINEEDRRLAYAEAGTTERDELRRLRVKVREHGELGPVLTDAGHHFTGPKQLKRSNSGGVDAERTTEQLEETLGRLERSQEMFASDGTRRRIDEIRAELARRSGSGGDGGDENPPAPPASDDPDPLDLLALGDRVDAQATAPHPLNVAPPSYAKAAPFIAQGDPTEFFDDAERATVGRLTAAEPGIQLLSVAELDKVLPKGDKQRRGPDAVLAGTQRTVELKSLAAREGETHPNAIKRHLRWARTQSRIAVVDGVDEGLTREDAIRGLRGAVGTYGDDFDLLVVLLGDGTAVHWRRG